MSSLEVHLAGSSEDKLIRSLHFDQKASAQYVTSRSEASYPSTSGGSFSPSNGIRVLRFALNDGGSAFLSGETVRLAITVRNDTAAPITPISLSPSSLFRRFRLLSGVELEDVQDYGRYHEMRQTLKSSREKLADMSEGWGGTASASATDLAHNEPIPAGGERRVLCRFFSSFFMQSKKIILASMSNLTLELELDDGAACFAEPAATYTIIRPTLLCSLLHIAPSVSSTFQSHLLGGHTISYNCPSTAFTMKSSITSSTISIPITRGFARLSTVAFTFLGTTSGLKAVNSFAHPLDGNAPTGSDPLQYYLSIGSFRVPVFSVEGAAEQFYRTRMAMSILERNEGDLDITPHEFRSTKAIFALNLEKVLNEDPDVGHSGISSRNGSQVTLELQGAPVGAICFITCFFDSVVQLGPSGVVEMS